MVVLASMQVRELVEKVSLVQFITYWITVKISCELCPLLALVATEFTGKVCQPGAVQIIDTIGVCASIEADTVIPVIHAKPVIGYF